MSLENEYYEIKEEITSAKAKLAEAEAVEVTCDENNPFTIEERIERKERVIKGLKFEYDEFNHRIVKL